MRIPHLCDYCVRGVWHHLNWLKYPYRVFLCSLTDWGCAGGPLQPGFLLYTGIPFNVLSEGCITIVTSHDRTTAKSLLNPVQVPIHKSPPNHSVGFSRKSIVQHGLSFTYSVSLIAKQVMERSLISNTFNGCDSKLFTLQCSTTFLMAAQHWTAAQHTLIQKLIELLQ